MSAVGTAIVPDEHVRSLSEEEMAGLRRDDGAGVAGRRGRYWESVVPGLYQPVSLVVPFAAHEIGRPTAACWGYRAVLAPGDADAANGSLPVHLAAVGGGLDTRHMSHGRVQDLRRCRSLVETRLCRDPDLLAAQGYSVYRSAQDRLHYWKDLEPAAYREMIRGRVADTRRIFVAGFLDGVLAGYLESFIVGRVVYAKDLIVATDALRSGISTGLYADTIELGLRAGAIDAACLGLDTPEARGLTEFKTSLGFPVVHLPARHQIAEPMAAAIRALRPWAYYRLTGDRARVLTARAL